MSKHDFAQVVCDDFADMSRGVSRNEQPQRMVIFLYVLNTKFKRLIGW